MSKILNLTQHKATPEQVAAGVVDCDHDIRGLLNFDDIPTRGDMVSRAHRLAMIAKDGGFTKVMIGGAPFFMPVLENILRINGITPLYAFSRREVVEKQNEDGTVTKTAVFKHLGFVEGGLV